MLDKTISANGCRTGAVHGHYLKIMSLSDGGHERQNVLGCDGRQLDIPEMVFESAKDELIVSECIFFHVHPLVIEKMGDALANFHDGPPLAVG
jgi:hypothetical protein